MNKLMELAMEGPMLLSLEELESLLRKKSKRERGRDSREERLPWEEDIQYQPKEMIESWEDVERTLSREGEEDFRNFGKSQISKGRSKKAVREVEEMIRWLESSGRESFESRLDLPEIQKVSEGRSKSYEKVEEEESEEEEEESEKDKEEEEEKENVESDSNDDLTDVRIMTLLGGKKVKSLQREKSIGVIERLKYIQSPPKIPKRGKDDKEKVGFRGKFYKAFPKEYGRCIEKSSPLKLAKMYQNYWEMHVYPGGETPSKVGRRID